jgi:hypothetical protein
MGSFLLVEVIKVGSNLIWTCFLTAPEAWFSEVVVGVTFGSCLIAAGLQYCKLDAEHFGSFH